MTSIIRKCFFDKIKPVKKLVKFASTAFLSVFSNGWFWFNFRIHVINLLFAGLHQMKTFLYVFSRCFYSTEKLCLNIKKIFYCHEIRENSVLTARVKNSSTSFTWTKTWVLSRGSIVSVFIFCNFEFNTTSGLKWSRLKTNYYVKLFSLFFE